LGARCARRRTGRRSTWSLVHARLCRHARLPRLPRRARLSGCAWHPGLWRRSARWRCSGGWCLRRRSAARIGRGLTRTVARCGLIAARWRPRRRRRGWVALCSSAAGERQRGQPEPREDTDGPAHDCFDSLDPSGCVPLLLAPPGIGLR
jgi:hypothetical protein